MSDIIKYNKAFAIPAFGLHNTGVICYFNSMLQCLLSCSSVIEVFCKNKELQTRNNLCMAFWESIKKAKLDQNSDIQNISPYIWSELIKRLKSTNTLSNNFGQGQEDCNDGFVRFLDALHAPEIEHLFETRYRHKVVCTDCNHIQELPADENVFLEISKNEITSESFKDIISKQVSKIEEYTCTKCKSKCVKQKYTQLKMVSEVIVILLKKYDAKWSIEVPQELELGDFKYKLIAINDHSGSRSGGHYWANALRNDDKVYNLNDTHVSPGSLTTTSSSYMLWYHAF